MRVPHCTGLIPAAAGVFLQFLNQVGRLRLRQIVRDRAVRLLSQCVQVTPLRTRHRFVACDLVGWVLFRRLVRRLLYFVAHVVITSLAL